MSDKEADKFNNINLSSDSDQGNKSNKKELSDALSNQAPLQQSSSSRRSLRRRKLCDSKVENKLIPTKKKKKRKAKKKEYTFHEITFKRDCSEINDSRFKGPCYCKSQTTKCIKLTEEDRKAIFEHVKSLPVDWRYGYVTELVRRLPIRGKYAMKKPSRKRSWVIYFHLTKLCGTILPVCKLMFLNTTGLTANFIHKSLLKKEIEDSQIIDTESLHYEGDNNKQKLASKSEHSDQHDVTKKELPDQHDDTPSLLCQFDDQNNPIVMTTPHSRTLHTTKPTSIQCEHVDKSDVDKSDTCHHQETLDADCSRLSPPPPTVAVEASEFHPITSSESSHLTASIVSCDNKYVDKSLQSMNMNHPSQFLTEDMWVPRHNKTPRDLGQSYISKRGKFVPARKLKDRCRCRSITTKCNQFTEDDRKAVFEYVWSLAKDEKKDFISDYVERLPVKRRRAMTSKKEWTFQFHLKKITGDVIPVCKKMFMKTTSLTSFLIRSVVAKKDSNYATMIEPGSLFYSKYSYDDQHDVSMDENPEPFNDTPSLVCQFDDQNNPIVVTSWESRFPQYSSDDKMPAVENGDDDSLTEDEESV